MNEEKVLTEKLVKELGLDKVEVITSDMIEGYTIIGNYAFYDCSALTSITIPNSVTSIGDYTFRGCSSLASITLPNSVTSIGDFAFIYCSALTSIVLPNSVTSIGDYAFYSCSSLTVVDNLRYADTYLVEAVDKSLSTYTIKAGTKWIGDEAFSMCSFLTSITIPNSVTSIGNWVFGECTSLTSMVVESGNTIYDSRENCNAIIETATNTLIAGCQSTTIPNSITSIGEYAFWDCSALTSITIPNSVTSIGNYAFEKCSSLTSITIPNSVTSIGYDMFYACNKLKNIIINNKTYEIQKVTNGKCKAYKAFKGDMTCREFQYEEGKTYEIEDEPKICKHGFHACLNLADVFNYYFGKIGKNIVVYEVELENVSEERNENDSKVVAKKITIGKRIL